MSARSGPRLRIEPLTAERWDDFAELFGPRGACGGCWCMWPKLARKDFVRLKGAGTRRRQRERVGRGEQPGVLAYAGNEAVGWCAVEPRQDYPLLARSRVLKPVDELPVWSIFCLFVRRDCRRLIEGAVDHARRHGARLLEAYPQDPRRGEIPAVFAHTGLASAFTAAGFCEVARRSPTRPIMRRAVRPRRP